MLERNPNSRKGDNGKVMVIAGSALFHGAPILCALGAEFSGVDLVYPFIPACHAEAAKTFSLNFIMQTFEEDMLTLKDVDRILHFSEKISSVVIGPGLGSDAKTEAAVKKILAKLNVPAVVDASALNYTSTYPAVTILTPHRGEFHALTGSEATPKNIQKWAKDLKVTMLCKGPEDVIADADHVEINHTGNALMTVGGSGDVLAGLVAGLLAMGLPAFEAAKLGVKVLGETGDSLAKTQGSLRAIDLAMNIPMILE